MKAQEKWKEYSVARNEMLLRTNFKSAAWFVVNAEQKENTHIALITHLLNQVKYHNKDHKVLRTCFPSYPREYKRKIIQRQTGSYIK